MTALHATISNHPFDLSRDQIERAMRGVSPETIQTHYAIVSGRRFPPKQVIAVVTGLDRSDFISTQARSILERLGFTVGRVGSPPKGSQSTGPVTSLAPSPADERLAAEADMLRPYRGQFVAVNPDWTEVIVSGPDPRSVSRALRALDRVGVVFGVPMDPTQDIGGFAW